MDDKTFKDIVDEVKRLLPDWKVYGHKLENDWRFFRATYRIGEQEYEIYMDNSNEIDYSSLKEYKDLWNLKIYVRVFGESLDDYGWSTSMKIKEVKDIHIAIGKAADHFWKTKKKIEEISNSLAEVFGSILE